MLKDLLQFKLKLMARFVLARHRPKVIAITGSVGKTSAKDAIIFVLGKHFSVNKSQKNYNNEYGVPLAILGADAPGRSIGKWLDVGIKFLQALFSSRYPKILVLEFGADHPGDIDYLTRMVKPDVGVVTRVGSAHLEFFGDLQTVQKEKSSLIAGLPTSGTAILNADDSRVVAMRYLHKGPTITYGLDPQADIRAVDVHIEQVVARENFFPATHIATAFNLVWKNKTYPMVLAGILGLPAVYAALAALAASLAVGLSIDEAQASLPGLGMPPGRLRPLSGIKQTIILDGTYNSSPEAAVESLKILTQVRGHRKIAVLGDMLELGAGTESAHRRLGGLVSELGLDLLFTVGQRARFIADEARKAGFQPKNIFEFEQSDEAGLPLQDCLKAGDVVLVKGSQGMRMEKIVLEIMSDPQRAGELLCRQDESWRM